MRHAFDTSNAPAPSAGYSQVVQIGNVIWTAGQAGLDPQTRELVSPDIEGQTEQTFRNLEAVLKAAGTGLEHVIRVGVFLSDLSSRERMNAKYAEVFGDPPPARTTVGAVLPPGMLIEVDAMAVLY